MRIKLVLGLMAAIILLAGCSNSTQLNAEGQRVRFTDVQPGSECQFLGTVTGTQSNWLSGNGNENGALRGAANDLRNRAASINGNVIYGAISPTHNLLAQFVPIDSKMTGQVYKCP